jgi:hypothetical protein
MLRKLVPSVAVALALASGCTTSAATHKLAVDHARHLKDYQSRVDPSLTQSPEDALATVRLGKAVAAEAQKLADDSK